YGQKLTMHLLQPATVYHHWKEQRVYLLPSKTTWTQIPALQKMGMCPTPIPRLPSKTTWTQIPALQKMGMCPTPIPRLPSKTTWTQIPALQKIGMCPTPIPRLLVMKVTSVPRKRKWSEVEIAAVEEKMMKFIHSGVTPGKVDCMACITAAPKALGERDWQADARKVVSPKCEK
ncbi:hypothetical protein F2P79_013622, partial [Pimephales promelas]